MNRSRELPDELVWEGGHLSEVALTALADGQDDALPTRARHHVATCVACTHALGAAALLSSHIDGAFAGAGAQELVRSSESVRRPIPMGGVMAALILAVVGALPALSHAPAELGEMATAFVNAVPAALRGGVAVLRSGDGMAPLVSVFASFALVLTGLAVARAMPRPFAA